MAFASCDETTPSLQQDAQTSIMMPPMVVGCLQADNPFCADCGEAKPDWASLTYGTLVCLKCAGQHRALGVAVSVVRSLHMDDWSDDQIRRMQCGGNAACKAYFQEAHQKYIDQVTAEDKGPEADPEAKAATSLKQLHLDFDTLTVGQVYDSNVGRAYEQRLDAIATAAAHLTTAAADGETATALSTLAAPPVFCLPPLQLHSALFEVVDGNAGCSRSLAKRIKGRYSSSHGYNFSANRGMHVNVAGKFGRKDFDCVPTILRSVFGLRRTAASC